MTRHANSNATNPVVALFGAFDRFNYGDMLFPHILTESFRRKCQGNFGVRLVGLRSNSSERYGALPTESLSELLANSRSRPPYAVVVAGGEVLGTRWATLWSHYSPPLFGDPAYRVLSRAIGPRWMDSAARLRFGASWDTPFSVRSIDLPGQPSILYNAVGGVSLSKMAPERLNDVQGAMRSSAYASVRDRATLEAIDSGRGEVQLVPDSVALLRTYWPIDTLKTMVERTASQVTELVSSRYVCFQSNRDLRSHELREVAAQLDEIVRSAGLNVVLLPLAYVSAHSDRKALRKIADYMSSPAVVLPRIDVLEITYLLANAEFFVGTSLHGAITAMAYGVPYAGLSVIPKVTSYLGTWAVPPFSDTIEVTEISSAYYDRRKGYSDLLAAESQRLARLASHANDALIDAIAKRRR